MTVVTVTDTTVTLAMIQVINLQIKLFTEGYFLAAEPRSLQHNNGTTPALSSQQVNDVTFRTQGWLVNSRNH